MLPTRDVTYVWPRLLRRWARRPATDFEQVPGAAQAALRATDLSRWHGPGAALKRPHHAARLDTITYGSGDLLDTYSRFSSTGCVRAEHAYSGTS
eukprot:scaffold8023_cov30-Phaeocystis_antarctica.AAC.1